MAQTITNRFGSIDVVDAPPDLLQRLRAVMPLGVVPLTGRPDGATFGIVAQCGDQLLQGVKFRSFKNSRNWVNKKAPICDLVGGTVSQWPLLSLNQYRRERFTGAIIPITFIRRRTPWGIELGFGCFAFPTPEDSDSPYHQGEEQPKAGQEPGVMCLAQAFIRENYKAKVNTGTATWDIKRKLTLHPFKHFGHIEMDFMVLDRDIIYLKPAIDPAADIWEALCSNHIKGPIIHMPSTVVKIEPDQLTEATGKADLQAPPEAALQAA